MLFYFHFRRDKTMNYFSIMVEKRLKNDDDNDLDEEEKKKAKKEKKKKGDFVRTYICNLHVLGEWMVQKLWSGSNSCNQEIES